MNIFWWSLSGILGVVGVGLVYLSLLDGHYQVRRSIVIARARAVVFDKIMDFRSWSEWSPWLMREPDTPLVFSDRPEQVGGYYTWDAKMIGAGKLTHVATKPPTEIKQQIEFIRPFRATCQVVWELAETADGNTKVTWGMDGQMPFLFRFLAKRAAEMIARDYDLGLAMLNGVLDQNADFPRLEFIGRSELAPQRYHYEAYRGGLKGMQAAMAAGFSRLFKQAQLVAAPTSLLTEGAAALRPWGGIVTARFDDFILADWSANSKPKPGKDSIWLLWYDARKKKVQHCCNPRTRYDAERVLIEWMTTILRQDNRRAFCGFDFGFGYPRGVAEKFPPLGRDMPQKPVYRVWSYLAKNIKDDSSNCNNRFDVAQALKQKYGLPFWGKPHNGKVKYPGIPRKKSVSFTKFPEWRRTEKMGKPNVKSMWQLMYIGAVGSQVLMGLPSLWRLRFNTRQLAGRVQIWPFDTGLNPPQSNWPPLIIGEIWPGIVSNKTTTTHVPDIKDAQQIYTLAKLFAEKDYRGEFAAWFAPPHLDKNDCRVVEDEEGWILRSNESPRK